MRLDVRQDLRVLPEGGHDEIVDLQSLGRRRGMKFDKLIIREVETEGAGRLFAHSPVSIVPGGSYVQSEISNAATFILP